MGLENFKRRSQIGFSNKPLQKGINHTPVNAKTFPIILTEVDDLFKKGAIETVPQSEINQGFYSTFFWYPRKAEI